MATLEAKYEVALAAIEQVGLLNNNNKALPKYIMAIQKESLKQTHLILSQAYDTKLQEALQQKDIEYKNELQEKLNERDTEHSKVVSDLKIELKAKDKIVLQLSDDTVELQYQADSSSQYNRKDNIKITGVPYEQGENLMQILKDITQHIGREITDQDISDIHRVNPQTESNGGTNRIPNIIVRVNRRTVKHDIFAKKRHLRAYPHPRYTNVGIYEDLTPLRNRMLYALRNKTNMEGGAKKFKFTWSKEGRLYCRTEEQTQVGPGQKLAKPGIVNKPQDLLKLGFSESEVNDIIYNKRK